MDKDCVVQVVDDDKMDITENSHQMKTKLCGALFRALGEGVNGKILVPLIIFDINSNMKLHHCQHNISHDINT